MGTETAPPPEQCATTAKTSEWERAGYKTGGPGGLPPALFLPISREKWGPPPGRRSPKAGKRPAHPKGTQHRAASGRGAGLGPSQVQTCNVVSRPTPGGSPAFSGESRRKERRGPCPLDPLFLWPACSHSLVLALGAALFRSWGYFVTHLRALIWKLSFLKMLFSIFFSKMRPKSVLGYRRE